MSDEKKPKPYVPHECGCVPPGTDLVAGVEMAGEFIRIAKKYGLCVSSAQSALENMLVTVGGVLAIQGTIIEPGSQEAEWETQRILTGIEDRCLSLLAYCYEGIRANGTTKEAAHDYFDRLKAAVFPGSSGTH